MNLNFLKLKYRLRNNPVDAKSCIRFQYSDRPHRKGLRLLSKEPNALK